MPRRLNFTRRKRILRDHVTIRVERSLGGGLVFELPKLDLAHYGLDRISPPPKVYIEAYRGSTATWIRFDCGYAARIELPDNRSLDQFGVPEGILFRVRVTAVAANDHGRLLAEADAIRPLLPGEDESSVEPLIQHMPADDIGDELWRLDFSGEMPLLKVNSGIPSGVEQFLLDQRYRAIFAPAVMRQVLTRILVIDKHVGDEEDEHDWRQRWLRFASGLTREEPIVDGPGELADVEGWIDRAVESFARKLRFRAAFGIEEAA